MEDKEALGKKIFLEFYSTFILDDEIEETGLGAGVMNHPAHGIRWVCRRFAPHGIGLEPGQVILSGSFIRPVSIAAGDRIRAEYGPLGTIDISFS